MLLAASGPMTWNTKPFLQNKGGPVKVQLSSIYFTTEKNISETAALDK